MSTSNYSPDVERTLLRLHTTAGRVLEEIAEDLGANAQVLFRQLNAMETCGLIRWDGDASGGREYFLTGLGARVRARAARQLRQEPANV